MKKLILTLICVVGLSSVAYSDDTHETCKRVEQIAGVIMEKRQAGASMSAMIDATNSVESSSKNLLNKIIKDAYDYPRYSSEEYRQEAVSEFENKYYGICLKIHEE